MGKRKPGSSAVPVDENDDGWLSTRNKKKLSPPPLKTPRGRHSLHRPLPRSPLVLLMEETPLQLQSTKKQTSIADFFTPRLKDISAKDHTIHQEEVVQQGTTPFEATPTEAADDGDEMCTDFDMPSPSLSQTSLKASPDGPSKTANLSLGENGFVSASHVESQISEESHHGQTHAKRNWSSMRKSRLDADLGKVDGRKGEKACRQQQYLVSSHRTERPVHDGQLMDSLQTPDFLNSANNCVDLDCNTEEFHRAELLELNSGSPKTKGQRFKTSSDEAPSRSSQEQFTMFTDLRSIRFSGPSQSCLLTQRENSECIDPLSTSQQSTSQSTHQYRAVPSQQSTSLSTHQYRAVLSQQSTSLSTHQNRAVPSQQSTSLSTHQYRAVPSEPQFTQGGKLCNDSMMTPAFSCSEVDSLEMDACSAREIMPDDQEMVWSLDVPGSFEFHDLQTPGFLKELHEDCDFSQTTY